MTKWFFEFVMWGCQSLLLERNVQARNDHLWGVNISPCSFFFQLHFFLPFHYLLAMCCKFFEVVSRAHCNLMLMLQKITIVSSFSLWNGMSGFWKAAKSVERSVSHMKEALYLKESLSSAHKVQRRHLVSKIPVASTSNFFVRQLERNETVYLKTWGLPA